MQCRVHQLPTGFPLIPPGPSFPGDELLLSPQNLITFWEIKTFLKDFKGLVQLNIKGTIFYCRVYFWTNSDNSSFNIIKF